MTQRQQLDMKRGIIRLCEILICFSEKDFEYDVYSLVRAFYPNNDAVISYDREKAATGEFKRWISVDYFPSMIRVKIVWEDGSAYEEQTAVDRIARRTDAKNQVKMMVYRGLSKISQRTLPWGTLTGIRPTKIAMKMLDQGLKNTQIAEFMRNTYACSNEKTALAIAVANREKAIIRDIDYEKGYSLYVGIPFCPSICLYCSFGSHPIGTWEQKIEAYLQALKEELTFISEAYRYKKLHSIYVGGGTPTSLTAEQMQSLLRHITVSFDLTNVREFTVEAGRPDSITEEKLEVIRQFPVDRISINPQTMQQKTLDLIGRKHTVEEIYETFALARKLGFDNINMDLIIGLPGEGVQEIADTLQQIAKMNPDNLTIHSLALKRATRLNLMKEEYQKISFENSREIMDMTAKSAMDMHMAPYYLYRQKNIAGNFENVGYAKVDKAGIYNILIMEEKQTIMAAGAGAATKFVFDEGRSIRRVDNVKDVNQYIGRIDEMIDRKRAGIEKWK